MKKINEILIGSNNKGKFKEIADLLPKTVKKTSPNQLYIKSPDENGKTFIENSEIKANFFSKKSKLNLSKIDCFPIYFKFNRNFFKNNIFAIGESVYNVYPIAGQGFNLVLRDIRELYEKIKEHISLGMQIKKDISPLLILKVVDFLTA